MPPAPGVPESRSPLDHRTAPPDADSSTRKSRRESASGLTWLANAATLGWGLGLVVEAGARGATRFASATSDTAADTPLVSAVLSGLTGAGSLAFVGALVALPFVPLQKTLSGRLLGTLACAVGITGAAMLHTTSLVVRHISGLFPGWSTTALITESPTHFLSQASRSYPGALLSGSVALAITAFLMAMALIRGWPTRRASPRVQLLALTGAFLAAAAAPLSVVASGSTRSSVLRTPETALLASALAGDDPAARAPGGRIPPPGPPRGDLRVWLEELRASEGTRPNVLILMLESVSADHLGFRGYERNVTPNIDRLARSGLVMTSAFTTSSQSNYAQMAILSSQWPRRRRSLDVYRRLDYPRVLPQDVFARLGYETATISSQNERWLGMHRFQQTPTQHFFRDSHGIPGPKMGRTGEDKAPDHLTVGEVERWLDRRHDEPWYLYVNLQRTHFDYQLPADFPAPYQPADIDGLRERGTHVSFMDWERAADEVMRNRYDNALHYVDAQIGRILRYLSRRGWLEDTLIVLTSDHGEALGERGQVTHGKSLSELVVRPPLILTWPTAIESDTLDRPVSHLDIMPTVLDLLGIPPHPAYQGESVLGEQPAPEDRDAIFLTMQGLREVDAIVCHPWKLVDDRSAGALHLYNLERDPEERLDLIHIHPSVAQSLEDTLKSQIRAQLRYYNGPRRLRRRRFPPRLLDCPELPGR